jgi:hypothetical protein
VGLDLNEARDGVGSAEWIALSRPVVDPTDEGARELGRRYWAEAPRLTHGLVRVRVEEGHIELVAVGGVTLFRFGAPYFRAEPDHVECMFPIVGGLLVGRSGGSLAIVQRGLPPHLGLVVTGYQPRLASQGGDLFVSWSTGRCRNACTCS